MEGEKLFEVVIDEIIDPISFAANKNDFILKRLNTEYVNLCYQGYLILEIKNFKASDIYIATTNNNAYGYVNVKFIANVLKYAANDILVGVVAFADNSFVGGKYKDYMNIVIKQSIYNGTIIDFTPDKNNIDKNIVSIKAESVIHGAKSKVSVCGFLLLPDQIEEIYCINDEISDMKPIMKLINDIEFEFEQRTKLDKIQLFYPYKFSSQPTFTKIDNWVGFEFKINHLKNLIEEIKDPNFSAIGTWSRPLIIHRSSPFVYHKDTLTEDIVITPANIALTSLLINIYTWLKCIREHCDIPFDNLSPIYMRTLLRLKSPMPLL